MFNNGFSAPADPTFIMQLTFSLSINICVTLASFTFPTPHFANTTLFFRIRPVFNVTSYMSFCYILLIMFSISSCSSSIATIIPILFI